MLKKDLKEGETYDAKLDGRVKPVRLDKIRTCGNVKGAAARYDVTVLEDGRRVTFTTAIRFVKRVQRGDSLGDALATVTIKDSAGKVIHSPDKPPPRPSTPASELRDRLGPLPSCLTRGRASPTEKPPNLVVSALAGTGKTTTLIEGIRLLLGGTTTLTPSPQQRDIWDCLLLTKTPSSVTFAAFNSSIAAELSSRMPKDRRCSARTLHSLGYYAVRRAFDLKRDPDDRRTKEILSQVMDTSVITLRKEKPVLLKAVNALVGLCKTNLVSPCGDSGGKWGVPDETWGKRLTALADRHSVELESNPEEIFSLTAKVLDRSRDVTADGYCDFNDMIWLPVVLNLPTWKNDLLLVDERQDMNRSQMALALKAGKRVVAVGDVHQSIYGFAGADVDACGVLSAMLDGHDGRRLLELPLTVTRRCSKAVVNEAKFYVPEFEAHPDNSDGVVSRQFYPAQREYHYGGSYTETVLPDEQTYRPLVREGDMVLSRTNAVLVKEWVYFVKKGLRASIQGKDVAAASLNLIDRLTDERVMPCSVFQHLLRNWLVQEEHKEAGETHPNHSKMESLQTQYDVISCFMGMSEGMDTAALKLRITEAFTDRKDQPGVKLSSIHRAKGLESRRVFLIRYGGMSTNKMKDWELRQESNLSYVGITRAIEELVFVQ